MKKIMINYSITITSNHWPRRLKKIKTIIKLIIKQKKLFCFQKNINYYCNFVLTNDVYIKKLNRIYKKDLKFIKNINYYCNFILANDKFIKRLNKKFRKVNQPTDVLTFDIKVNTSVEVFFFL